MPQPLRVLHYNIYNGLNTHPNRPAPLLEILRDAPPDVLFLNEYQPTSGLADALPALGYHASVINNNHPSGNRAALFSRSPFNRVLPTPAEARFAAAIIDDTCFVAYHATPHGAAAVIPETQHVLSLLEDTDPVLLCGDLNSLSRLDRGPLNYDAADKPGQLDRYRIDGQLSYAAMDAFADAGFTDHRAPGDPHTVPTAVGRKNEGAKLRIDYVLSRGLSLTGVEVISGGVFDTLSDHYPLRAKMVMD